MHEIMERKGSLYDCAAVTSKVAIKQYCCFGWLGTPDTCQKDLRNPRDDSHPCPRPISPRWSPSLPVVRSSGEEQGGDAGFSHSEIAAESVVDDEGCSVGFRE